MNNACKYVILYLFCISLSYAKEFLDLEKLAQDFVLETKQIIVPGFAGAFNASVIRWHDKLLMCFRIRDEKMISTFEFGCVWLDDEFNVISEPHILEIKNDVSTFKQNQDPRLIIIDNTLYILYSNFIKIDHITTRRMFVAQMRHENERFFIENPVCLDPFPNSGKRWEKNWVPFNYNESLLLAYSLQPHTIFHPCLKTGICEMKNSTNSDAIWEWGELRGGTPALLDGDHYIAFFHSSKEIATVHSNGKKMQHYVMGAYVFSSEPPFEITHMSPEPIVADNFYSAPAYNTWKPLRVVFPMGCLIDERYIWITYGRQDFEIWVAKLDKKGLYQSLITAAQCKQRINQKIQWVENIDEEEQQQTYSQQINEINNGIS